MGTSGPGAFDNDDALLLLGWLAEADKAERLEMLKWIFGMGRLRPEDQAESCPATMVIAAAAVAAAGLEQGEAVRAEITGLGFEAAHVIMPESSPALADEALAALIVAAGPDGEWQQGWADAGTGLLARQTANRLASVLYRYQHRHEELPLEY